MLETAFQDKTVLITGHTGFKGSWLALWLRELGARVVGYAQEPRTARDVFVLTGLSDRVSHHLGDVRDLPSLHAVFARHQPEIVFHLAAQPIVRLSYQDPKATYDVNVGGTVNVLECCRTTESVRVVVNVTTDKCYENREWAWGYRENDTLGGYDPYSSSKACSELVTAAYRRSFFSPGPCGGNVRGLATARVGNVIGGGDWQADRIVPDCIRALENSEPVLVRNPLAVRPWQHVLDPLSGYLLLAAKLSEAPQTYGEAWNFGPARDSMVTVKDLVAILLAEWGSGEWRDISAPGTPHEAHVLCLDISKAVTLLGWRPVWGLRKALAKTVEWYKLHGHGDAYGLCRSQIAEFTRDARGGGGPGMPGQGAGGLACSA